MSPLAALHSVTIVAHIHEDVAFSHGKNEKGIERCLTVKISNMEML